MPWPSEHVERWRPDVLGEGFEQLTLPLGSDDEGEVVATLVRHQPPPERFTWRWPWEARPAASGADVLYVHGWSDYFFNPELARYWSNAGARFFALDLRKYGRSLRPGQTPGYITNLADYDADIEAALTAMGHGQTDAAGASARPLILLGHSTGGLTLSLWAARHPGRADALVLNSPWLEFQGSRIGREALTPVISWGARVNPMGPTAERRSRLLHPFGREGAGRRVGVLARVEARSGLHDASGLADGDPRGACHGRCGHRCGRARAHAPVGAVNDPAAVGPGHAHHRHRARRRRHRRARAEARPRGLGCVHRRGAARRVPVAGAGAGRRLRRDHAVAARLRTTH